MLSRVPSNGVGSTRWRRTLALQAYLSCKSTPVRLQSLILRLTYSDHVFLCLPLPLGPGSGNYVTDLIQDVAHCTWRPYHLSHLLWRTTVISLIPSFCSGETEMFNSIFGATDPVDHGVVIVWLSRWSRFRSNIFAPHVSLPWSIAEWTQAVCTLQHTLGERCLDVRQEAVSWFSPGHAASGSNDTVTAPTRAQHVTQIAASILHIKLGAFEIHLGH